MLNSVIDLKTLKIHVCMFTWQCYGFSWWWVLTGSLRLDLDQHFCIAIHNLLSTAAWQCFCIYTYWLQCTAFKREKLIKTFFGIYLIMYKLFRSKINPQFLRLEKRKDEFKFNFWMPDSLNRARPHDHPNLSLYHCDQCHFLAGWTTEAGVRICTR